MQTPSPANSGQSPTGAVPASVTLLVRGIEIRAWCADIENLKGRVINLCAGAQKNHAGFIWRIRKYVAHAFFRAGDLCHPSHNGCALRVVDAVVTSSSLNDSLTDRRHHHVGQVWPLYFAFGKAHYQPLVLHERVKRDYDGREIHAGHGFGWQKAALNEKGV